MNTTRAWCHAIEQPYCVPRKLVKETVPEYSNVYFHVNIWLIFDFMWTDGKILIDVFVHERWMVYLRAVIRHGGFYFNHMGYFLIDFCALLD